MENFNPEYLRKAYLGEGYALGLRFTPAELEELRSIVTNRWLGVLQEICPELVPEFKELGLAYYHKLSHKIEHSKIWGKSARMLPKVETDKILQMDFFKKVLPSVLGSYDIADFEGRGFEELTWRLVRPNEPQDIGPIHKDVWFTDLANNQFPETKDRVTIWTSLYTEPGLSGLLVVPWSQDKEFPFHIEERFGLQKPVLDVRDEDLDIEICETVPGDVIMFNPRMLHGGALNRGTKCRVSLELTGLFDKSLLESLRNNVGVEQRAY